VLALVGLAILLGTLSPVFVVIVFTAVIDVYWVRREERWLEEAFGEAYGEFRSRVRRWV